MSVYLPAEFIDAMRGILPPHLSFSAFLESCQRPLRRSIRVNTIKITVADFLALVAPYGWRLTPIPWCAEGFWIERHDEAQWPLGSAAEHLSGLFYIQEASSMLPVVALLAENVQAIQSSTGQLDEKQSVRKPCSAGQLNKVAGLRVLDMAAAPGSKTTQLAAAMGNAGLLLANEYSGSRIKVLHANISRCGVTNCVLTHLDGRVFGDCLAECFDAILLDAPCSGEGMVRKDADALRGWSPAAVQATAATQRQLIDSAFRALRPGGALVYSTCTLNHTENQQVCQYLLERYMGAVEIVPLNQLFEQANLAATAEGFLHVFPQLYDSEGFFVARLRKTDSLTESVPHSLPLHASHSNSLSYKEKNHACPSSLQKNQAVSSAKTVRKHTTKPFPFRLIDRQVADITQAAAHIGLCWPASLQLWQRSKVSSNESSNEIWLFPSDIDQFIGRVHLSRIGIKLAVQHNKGYRWQHEAVIALAGWDNTGWFALNASEAQQWYQGRDIYPMRLPVAEQVIVSFQGQPLGLAKKINRRLKNYYPRELVRNGRLFMNYDTD